MGSTLSSLTYELPASSSGGVVGVTARDQALQVVSTHPEEHVILARPQGGGQVRRRQRSNAGAPPDDRHRPHSSHLPKIYEKKYKF
ncbi:hypothetical protein CEXT_228151 [Caerostris extrusa]|uniref:Uncharacterized protein n=1 Tax=Caerostris extrusa TaxID=172846 RepID=A0AAV4TL42_CAEEX|nr:hypothetical protein CEXT_228151 [Caerostris extrusa]